MLKSLILFILVAPIASTQTVRLSDDIKERRVELVNYLPDPQGTLNIADLPNIKPEDFQVATIDTEINRSINAFWIKFSLVNSEEEHQNWALEFPQWSYVDFYYSEDGSLFDSLQTGYLLPYQKHQYPIANHNYVWLILKPHKEVFCYARLEPVWNSPSVPTNFSFNIIQRAQADAKAGQFKAFSYFFIGIYLVMLFYNLFIYFSTRDNAYFYYLITLFILIIGVLLGSGELESWFPKVANMRSIINLIYTFWNPALSIALLLFMKHFLKVKERHPKWDRIIYYLIFALIPLPFITLVNFDLGMMLSALLSIPFVVIIFTVGIKSYLEKYPGASYFVLGHLFWFLGGLTAMFTQLSILPPSDFLSNHALPLGSSIEMILFSLALANTINYLQTENEKKQQRIIAQLKENQLLQTKVNRELEEKVRERTQLISHQNEEITEQKRSLQIEKDRSERLLLNIFPKEIAEELKLNGHATPRFYEQVSILFVDIKGFSTEVGDISPTDLVKDLDYCFTGFDYIVARHNLEKIKTIGDAYLCVGGLPKENETHAVDIVNAALEMIEFTKKWQDENPVLAEDGLHLRLGINSGAVISGVVGKKKFQYDIWGDAVNLASRMESEGEPDKVNISGSTYELVKDHFDCEYRGKIAAKNMGEVDMYFVKNKI